jgi:hypothetical protein
MTEISSVMLLSNTGKCGSGERVAHMMRMCNGVVRAALLATIMNIVLPQVTGQLNQETNGGTPLSASAPQIPISHLYMNLLLFESHLEQQAIELEGQKKDATRVRNLLRDKLHLSDAEFASFRRSSQRLGIAMNDIRGKVASVQHGFDGMDVKKTKIKALAEERSKRGEAEITSLRASMTPSRRATFEADLMEFFAPKKSAHLESGSEGQGQQEGKRP